MKSVKTFYSFLALIVLTTGSLVAQTSGTATKPTATTSTNRQQELYDQYHGVTKKSATTSTTTPASVSTTAATPAQPQRQTSGYSNSSTPTTATGSRPQRISAEGSTAGVRIGVRGGPTYTFFTEAQPLLKSTVGFVGGLTFNFGAGTLSFQPEVNYARYGVKLSDNSLGINVKGAVDVIEVPLFLKISSGTYAGNRFFVNVGPYGAYLASRSADGKKVSLNGVTGRFGFGAALGLGAALKAGPGHVTAEVRGLYPLGNTEDGFDTGTDEITTQLTVGYSFPLGRR